MIPLHQAFPLLVRSRQAIIVGDPLQIEPVIRQTPKALENYFHHTFIEQGLDQTDYDRYSPGASKVQQPIIGLPLQLEKLIVLTLVFDCLNTIAANLALFVFAIALQDMD